MSDECQQGWSCFLWFRARLRHHLALISESFLGYYTLVSLFGNQCSCGAVQLENRKKQEINYQALEGIHTFQTCSFELDSSFIDDPLKGLD